MRSIKDEIVAKLLCRWWYAEEYIKNDWPPQDESFYQAELDKRKLRKVTIEQWEWLPEQDAKGYSKVYELSQFRGVYRNSAGESIDLRPKDRCPCQTNFRKKDLATLCAMLLGAYENQLKDLKNCRYNQDKCANDIKAAMTRTRQLLHESGELAKS
mmetsp:Transcript_136165/g.434797  ORF Transcript_136165/g.434797 Transcript_136165/m.434797 type:complete len:156 (-) Transcript_136165:88-555(-)